MSPELLCYGRGMHMWPALKTKTAIKMAVLDASFYDSLIDITHYDRCCHMGSQWTPLTFCTRLFLLYSDPCKNLFLCSSNPPGRCAEGDRLCAFQVKTKLKAFLLLGIWRAAFQSHIVFRVGSARAQCTVTSIVAYLFRIPNIYILQVLGLSA